MHTLMTQGAFVKIKSVRDALLAEDHDVAGIFVPWAGSRLIREGGIYYVGIATDGEYGAHERQTFERCYSWAATVGNGERHERSHTPFWRFLDELSLQLLRAPAHESADRWGWSNLLKIGCCNGSPSEWPQLVVTAQTPACIECLQQEFSRLKQTLIFIGSNDDYGIITESLPTKPQWDKSEEDAGVYSWWDEESFNLYIHGYHPGFAQRDGFFDAQLNKTVELARRDLPWISNENREISPR